MKTQVAARVDDDMLAQIKSIEKEMRADRSEVIRRLLDEGVRQHRLRKATEFLRDGKVTISRAAEIADISIWEMMDVMRDREIPVPYSAETLRRELELTP